MMINRAYKRTPSTEVLFFFTCVKLIYLGTSKISKKIRTVQIPGTPGTRARKRTSIFMESPFSVASVNQCWIDLFITLCVDILREFFFNSTVNFYFRWINSSLLLFLVLVYDMSYAFYCLCCLILSFEYVTWLFNISAMCCV